MPHEFEKSPFLGDEIRGSLESLDSMVLEISDVFGLSEFGDDPLTRIMLLAVANEVVKINYAAKNDKAKNEFSVRDWSNRTQDLEALADIAILLTGDSSKIAASTIFRQNEYSNPRAEHRSKFFDTLYGYRNSIMSQQLEDWVEFNDPFADLRLKFNEGSQDVPKKRKYRSKYVVIDVNGVGQEEYGGAPADDSAETNTQELLAKFPEYEVPPAGYVKQESKSVVYITKPLLDALLDGQPGDKNYDYALGVLRHEFTHSQKRYSAKNGFLGMSLNEVAADHFGGVRGYMGAHDYFSAIEENGGPDMFNLLDKFADRPPAEMYEYIAENYGLSVVFDVMMHVPENYSQSFGVIRKSAFGRFSQDVLATRVAKGPSTIAA
jgi:hypothetical protein